MSRGRGRPARYVIGRDRKPVVGLSREKKSGRFYATHTRSPRVYFGTDQDLAIMQFRGWQGRQTNEAPIKLISKRIVPHTKRPADVPPWGKWADFSGDVEYVELTSSHTIPPDAFFAKARELLLNDPAMMAERTGIPELARLHTLPEPEPSLTLQQLGEIYLQKKRSITTHWKRKATLYWREFRSAVGVRTLADLRQEHIQRYHDRLWSEAEKKGRSPTYIAQRQQTVRMVLRHALKQGRDQVQVRRVLDLTAIFEAPRKKGTDPHPISRADLHKLLAASGPKWKAVILLSLNGALYPSEVAAVKTREIDLQAGTMVMTRRKTGVPRIAVLWGRTVEAIREYQKAEPRGGDHLFVSEVGLPYNANHICRNFRRRREEAGLEDTVQFAHLRDGAYSAAIEGGADLTVARLLAGHRAGVSDHYLKRNPRMVEAACRAIERFYFE